MVRLSDELEEVVLTDGEIDAIVDYAIFIISKRKKEENEV